MILKVRPIVAYKRPDENKFRAFIYDIAISDKFDAFVMAMISGNTLLMTISWPGMSEQHQFYTEMCNYVFTTIFVIEAIIKLIAYEKRYFLDNWNTFDFVIVTSSLVMHVIVSLWNFEMFLTSTSQVMRTLRIGRIFKLFRGLKRLQVIFNTFLNTLGSIMNLGGLMLLIIYVYAVIGMNIFGTIKLKPPMHSRLNFQNIQNSFTSLLRITTGENWNDLMNALGMGHSWYNECKDDPTYEDYVKNGREPIGCGSYAFAYAFFASYLIVLTLIFLNLFIAVILNGYFETLAQERQYLKPEVLTIFKETWSRYD